MGSNSLQQNITSAEVELKYLEELWGNTFRCEKKKQYWLRIQQLKKDIERAKSWLKNVSQEV